MKHSIGGYEVSPETRLAYDRQQERNRQEEYRERQEREKLRLLREIAESLKRTDGEALK